MHDRRRGGTNAHDNDESGFMHNNRKKRDGWSGISIRNEALYKPCGDRMVMKKKAKVPGWERHERQQLHAVNKRLIPRQTMVMQGT